MNTYVHELPMPGHTIRYLSTTPEPHAVIGTVWDHERFMAHHASLHVAHNTSAHAIMVALADGRVSCEPNPRSAHGDDTHVYRLQGADSVTLTGGGDGRVPIALNGGPTQRDRVVDALPALIETATAQLAHHARAALEHLTLSQRPVEDHIVVSTHPDPETAAQAAVHREPEYHPAGVSLSLAHARVTHPEGSRRREITERIAQADRDTRAADPCVRASAHDLRAGAYADLAATLRGTDDTLAAAVERAATTDRVAAATTRFEYAIPTAMPLTEVRHLPLRACPSCGRPWQRASRGRCPHCPRLVFGATPHTLEQARDLPPGVPISLDEYAHPLQQGGT